MSDCVIFFSLNLNYEILELQYSSRVSSAVANSRYGSAGSSARSAPELIQSARGYRMSSANAKRGLRTDTAGGIVNDASDDDGDDPTLRISPGSETALIGVTK